MAVSTIGVDLGLTYARAAWVQDGKPVILETLSGQRALPAVVGIDRNGALHVGESARNQHLLWPERTAGRLRRLLGTSQRVVCGSPAYFSRHGVPRTPEELRQHNCLINMSMAPRDHWQFNIPGGETTVIKVGGTMQANVADALRIAALSGLGLVILPTYMVGQDIRRNRLQAVLTEYVPAPLEIHAVYPHRKHLSAKVRTFVDFLHERFHPKPYWEEWAQDQLQEA